MPDDNLYESPKIGEPTPYADLLVAFQECLTAFGEASKQLALVKNEETRTAYHNTQIFCLVKYSEILGTLQRLHVLP